MHNLRPKIKSTSKATVYYIAFCAQNKYLKSKKVVTGKVFSHFCVRFHTIKQTEILERRDGVDNRKTVAIIGGDARMLACARALKVSGWRVLLCGFEDDPAAQADCLSLREALLQVDTVVFPLPASKDGRFVFAPFARHSIELDDKLAEELTGKQVFCGMRERLPLNEKWKAIPVIDYYQDETLLMENARITAEAALFEVMNLLPCTLYDCRCLVAGFGRIGKALTARLLGLGATVTVAARKEKDREAAQKMRAQAVSFAELLPPCDVIFNTVPAPVFSCELLPSGQNSLYVELASSPGLDQAPDGIKILKAASLPGKYAPDTAGRAIAAVLLGEGKGGKA